MSRKSLLIAACIAIFSLLFILYMGNANAQESLEAAILRLAAQTYDLPNADLEIAALKEISLPVTGVSYYQAKVVDTKTGQVYGLTVDPSVNPIDAQSLRQAEKDAAWARYGALQPGVYQQLQGMASDAPLAVGIWLKSVNIQPLPRLPLENSFNANGPIEGQLPEESLPTPQEPPRPKPPYDEAAINAERAVTLGEQQADLNAQIAAWQQANLQVLATKVGSIEAPFLADLKQMGYEPIYASPYAPLVYIELPKSAILVLAQRTDIDAIYGPNQYHDLLDIARPTQKADWVGWFGITGSGVKLAMLEDGRVNTSNPYFHPVTVRDPAGLTDQHANATAGIVASNHSTYIGIAHDVTLYSANTVTYSDANISAAIDWALAQGVSIISSSWGSNDGTGNLNVHDRHFDYIVGNAWVTVSTAAGNEADGCGAGDGRVGSPSRAYSVITVGNYDDNRTLTWDDDFMDACSSYVDPDSEPKPEVSAVGSHSLMSLMDISPWYGDVGSGTSYSAPMVAGAAALLQQRNSGLKIWPETIKAIMMAASLHNIEGGTRFSDKDGAGGVDMRAAFKIVDEGWNMGLDRSGGGWADDFYLYVTQGQVARGVVAWDSVASGDYASDILASDIDLQVYDPSGGLVTYSTSSTNAFEMVEFTAATTGNYRLHIYPYSMTGSEYIGVAAWEGSRGLNAYAPQTWSTPPVSRHSFTFNRGINWNVVGIRPSADDDNDIRLYLSSPFGDPADFVELNNSLYSLGEVDFIVIDGNHAPSTPYYVDINHYMGSDSYQIEWGTSTADTNDGVHGPYIMTPNNVVRAFDSWLTGGLTKYYGLKITSGNADLAMALYLSTAANSSTYYQGRDEFVVNTDLAGAGGNEYMSFTNPGNDWVGLVVWNKGSSTDTTFYLYSDVSAPSAGSIVINSGAAYANSTTVNLTLSAVDAETGIGEMQFSNDNITWSTWEAYATSKSWTLTSGDGSKTVYARYRNNAGMMGSTYNDSITLDTISPNGSININSGATYATNVNVTLNLWATDATSGVYQMRFSNNGSTFSSWEAYATSKNWTLTSGDGAKTVYVQYRDNALNVSSSYSDGITLDTIAPTGSISVNSGATYTNNPDVTLTLSATDATSGVYQMRFSNDNVHWSLGEAYATSKSWTLSSGDGAKTVYVQYRDNAWNESISYSDGITLDTVAPTGSININSGATYATNPNVTLNLLATDATSGVYQMRFSNNGSTFSSWEAYATSKSWTLTSGDGAKTVYVQYRDNAWNVSSSYNDGITLDSVAPTGSISINSGATYATNANVTLTLSATDATSGVFQMHFSNNGSTWSSWEAYATSKSWTLMSGDGAKTVYIQYRDNALNVSSSYSDGITLDTVAPVSSATSPARATVAGFLVSWSGTDATSGIQCYDVQYKVGSSGSWITWRSCTSATSAMFGPTSPVTLVIGETYYFRVRAHDNAGNVESYPSVADTSTTVLFEVFLPTIVK